MAKLQDVISSVLQDVLSAQQEANIFTQSLVELYQDNGALRSFNIPAVTIGDMELSFHFAIGNCEELRSENTPSDLNSMDVIFDSEQLAHLPNGAIQSLSLKISPQTVSRSDNE